MALFSILGSLSALGASLQESSQDHVGRILQMFVAATVIRYSSAFKSLAETILDLGFSLESLTSVQLADALVVLSLARSSDPESGTHSATAIKAIRWVKRTFEVACYEVAYSPLIASFLKSKIPRERKEAVPLSLYVVMHFERRLLMQEATDSEESCLRVGMTPELYGKLKEKGYDTFGKIAFAAASSPQALTDEAIDEWLATVVDPRPSAFQAPDPVCDTNGAYALRQAFFRRSLALDLGNLCTFEVMEEWVNSIFELTQRQVPTGYTKVSLSQIVAADKELFIRAANNLEGKLQKPVGAAKPLDSELKRLSVSHDITQFLSPLLSPPPPAHPTKRPQDGDDDAPPKKVKGKGDKGNKGGGKGRANQLRKLELLKVKLLAKTLEEDERKHGFDDMGVVDLMKKGEASNSEVAEHFIEGPYTEAQVTQIFGHSVNEAFTSLIKLELQGADFVSGLALLIARAEKERSDRLGVPARQWLGRTLDLSKAYKQLAVLPLHRDIAVICHPNEKGEPQFFVANALMFGLTSSVYGFVRVARSLHFLLCKVLKIPSANYFDDYPLFALREGAQELDGLTSEFLELLGWRFAQTGIKGQPYEETFTVLGMQLDVSRLHEGVAVLANKEGRVKRIAEMLGNIFDRGTLGRHEAQVLLGLLNYASGFFAGRSLKPACHFLLSLVRGKRPTAAEIQRFCKTTQAVLSTTPPRILRIFDPRPPIHVWTDGAWEDPWAGIGAVVLDTLDDSARVFAGCVPTKLLERWKLDVGSQLICEIELYALVTLRRMLQNSLCNRRVIFWLDNEAARTSAIKGLSKSESMYRLAHYLAVIEAEAPCVAWYERVPSFSNVADPPSRGDGQSILSLVGAKVVDIIPALRGQQKLRYAITGGARFMTPLHRGSQHPLEEPPVQIESFSKVADSTPFEHFPQFVMQDGLHLPEFEKTSEIPKPVVPAPLWDVQSSDEESLDSSGDESPNLPDLGDAEEFVLASSTGVHHAMVPTSGPFGITFRGQKLRPVCGVYLEADNITWCEQYSPAITLCKRADSSSESDNSFCLEYFAGSWVESFAPKISSSSISEMKRKYLVNYPSEILNYSTQPSTRLLSLASHQQNKKDWRWIPWKFRMTEERASEILMSRPNKQSRLEAIGLSGMLLDEPPALEIQDHSMGVNAIQKLMNVHDVSLAMVGTAHLARLKGYTTKFISLLSQKFDASSGLRPPSVLEAQQADCRLWQGMITLVTDKGWTMDDALYEFTEVRGEMPSLLQARARPPPIPKGWDGKGKTNKGLGKMLVESYAKGYASQAAMKGKGKDKGKSKEAKGGSNINFVKSIMVGFRTFRACSSSGFVVRGASHENPQSAAMLVWYSMGKRGTQVDLEKSLILLAASSMRMYLRLAKQLHPDVNKAAGAEQSFQKVRDAYEVLSNDDKRREYDRQIAPPDRGPRSGPDPRATWMYRSRTGQPGGMSGKPFGFTDEAAWRARQEYEEMRRRAEEAQFYAEFNQYRYRQSLFESLLRFVPLVVPLWFVAMLFGLYRRSRSVDQGNPAEMLYWDEFDRAWARDAYGRIHRLPDLDKQR
ncbi:dnaJ [Symbiodinium sp. CCMP2592]|nr:dnaJ [Symbiodinium sp. CCMP2592]